MVGLVFVAEHAELLALFVCLLAWATTTLEKTVSSHDAMEIKRPDLIGAWPWGFHMHHDVAGTLLFYLQNDDGCLQIGVQIGISG